MGAAEEKFFLINSKSGWFKFMPDKKFVSYWHTCITGAMMKQNITL